MSDASNKLKNGLSKIDETRAKVEQMSIELEIDKKKVAQFQKECEEYLVVLVQQKREADEQRKVTAGLIKKKKFLLIMLIVFYYKLNWSRFFRFNVKC